MKRTILITGFLALAMLISACGLSIPTASALNEPETVFELAEPSDEPTPEPIPEPSGSSSEGSAEGFFDADDAEPTPVSDTAEGFTEPLTVFPAASFEEGAEPVPVSDMYDLVDSIIRYAEDDPNYTNWYLEDAEDFQPVFPSVGNYYPRAAYVVELDYERDIVVVEDGCGLLWEYTGISDSYPGDLVALIMDDNGTPNFIYDDIIACARYAGFSL